jgi:tetratricopeptide (TPR) repeat protein
MKRASNSVARPATAAKIQPAEKIQVLLALALREYHAEHMAEVERLCLQILTFDVRHADGLYLLGMAGFKTKRYEMAERMIRRAIAANPLHAFYHSNLGNALKAQNKLDEAVPCYERALEIKPDHEEACYNLANTFLTQKKLDEAVALYQRALKIKPGYVDAMCNLGTAYRQQKKLVQAIDCFERAMLLAPEHPDLCCNLGDALHAQGKVDEAIGWYQRTLKLNPEHSKACNCLCNGYFDKGDLVQSTAWCERALALEPDFGDARMNQCLLQLLQGDYLNGWRNYEVRWKVYTPRTSPQPRWLGAPLRGARVLLHAEQGLGDSLQFLRYVPLVQAAGGKVMLDLPAKLHRLAKGFPGILALVNTGEPLPYFDCHCPLMSLPLALGTTLQTVPAQVPYLSVPPEALAAAAALPWPASGLKVGLAWTGNPDHPKNRFRSVPLELLEPLLDLPGVHFFSLQMGPAAAELAARKLHITDLAPITGDMADTAAQMANLDLIVTIDTSMAHLAGALARPVWVLLGYSPDWRWLMGREDSPWYPTARLFRQTRDDDWRPVIERVRTALRHLAAQKQATREPGNL